MLSGKNFKTTIKKHKRFAPAKTQQPQKKVLGMPPVITQHALTAERAYMTKRLGKKRETI